MTGWEKEMTIELLESCNSSGSMSPKKCLNIIQRELKKFQFDYAKAMGQDNYLQAIEEVLKERGIK